MLFPQIFYVHRCPVVGQLERNNDSDWWKSTVQLKAMFSLRITHFVFSWRSFQWTAGPIGHARYLTHRDRRPHRILYQKFVWNWPDFIIVVIIHMRRRTVKEIDATRCIDLSDKGDLAIARIWIQEATARCSVDIFHMGTLFIGTRILFRTSTWSKSIKSKNWKLRALVLLNKASILLLSSW